MVKKNQPLTQESFDKLLAWLHPNREQAGQKYEGIYHELIKLFLRWGSQEPEEDADATINRVACEIDAIEKEYTGDPASYFYTVARSVYVENHRIYRSEAA